MSALPSASPKNTILTASVPKSILKKTNMYDLARPIIGVSEQEMNDFKNTVAKPPTGAKKCKVSFQSDEPAPLGAQLKVGRRLKYATVNETVIADKKGRSRIVRRNTLPDNGCSASVAMVYSVFNMAPSKTNDLKFVAQACSTSNGVVYNMTNVPRHFHADKQDCETKTVEPIPAQPRERASRMIILANVRLPGGSQIPKKGEVTKEASSKKQTEFGMDDHADCCVIPAHLLPDGFDFKKLKKVDGTTSGVTGHSLKILGETKLDVQLSEVWFQVRFIVVEDKMPYPLLGNDFRHYTKATMDWARRGFQFEVPGQNRSLFVPLIDESRGSAVRVNGPTKLLSRTATRVSVKFADDATDKLMLVDRACTTSGELNIPTCVTKVHRDLNNIYMYNWGSEDVEISDGGLIGQAWEAELKPKKCDNGEYAGSPNRSKWYDNYSQFQIVMAAHWVATKIEDDNPNCVFAAHGSESFEEHVADIKEHVSNAKIGDCNKRAMEGAKDFLSDWVKVFAQNTLSPKPYNGPYFRIPTGAAHPIKHMPRRMNPGKELQVRQHVEQMLANGIIEEANSPWSAPVVMARKKDGSWRFCVDYRALNAVMKKESYPLPQIDDTLDALGFGGGKIFSSLDVASGYWHIPIENVDKEKTAFTTNAGTYQFCVVPFGLTGAPGAFCRAMNATLKDYMWKFCLVFVDDIIVWSKTWAEHKQHLAAIFSKLHEQGFQLKLSKCQFFQTKIEFLGFVIEEGRITVDPKKVSAIADLDPPLDLKSLQRFLGMTGWYRRFVKDYAMKAAPLTDLMKKDQDGKYEIHIVGSEQNLAFESLKKSLTEYPIVRLPDFTKPFVLITDASGYATGAMLAQEHDGFEHPVHYFSKVLLESQRKKPSYNLEVLALVRALRYFKHYLEFSEVLLVTDCRALSYWNTTRDIPDDVKRYLGEIAASGGKLVHRPGEKIPTADALSRDTRFLNENVGRNYTEIEMNQRIHRKREFEPTDLSGSNRAAKDLHQVFKLAKPEEIRLMSIWGSDEDLYENAVNLTATNLWEGQLEHSPTKRFIEFLQGEKKNLSKEELGRFEAMKDNYFLLGGGLYYKTKDDRYARPYIPPGALRRQILRHMHDDILAGHTGVARTTDRILSRYYWEGAKTEIETYVLRCPCHLNKTAGRARNAELAPLRVRRPFQDLHVDFVGPWNETTRKNKYVLNVIDRYTKWIELIPTRDNSMSVAWKKFEKRILHRWGTPETVTADNAFKGAFKVGCEQNGIVVNYALPHQHKTNGLVERANRTVNETMRNYVNADKNNWDEKLSGIQFALNTAKATSHGMTPYNANTGREAVLPIQRLLETNISEEGEERRAENRESNVENDNNDNNNHNNNNNDESTNNHDNTMNNHEDKITNNHESCIMGNNDSEKIDNHEEKLEKVVAAETDSANDSDADYHLSDDEDAEEAKQQQDKKGRKAIKKHQKKMIAQDAKKKNLKDYKEGEWVSIKKPVKDTKLDSTRMGPFKIVGHDKSRTKNYIIQFMGLKGTDLVVHTDDLLPWKGLTDKSVASDFARAQKLAIPQKPAQKIGELLQNIRKRFKLAKNEDIRLNHIVGRRVRVNWGSPINEICVGTVMAQEKPGQFWIKYDELRDPTGTNYFLENLLVGRPPTWWYDDSSPPDGYLCRTSLKNRRVDLVRSSTGKKTKPK